MYKAKYLTFVKMSDYNFSIFNRFTMDIRVSQILKKLGFSEKETSVYLVLLSLASPQTANVIAGKISFPRSTTYGILQDLFRKGFVSRFLKSNVQHFSAIPPESLFDFFEEKARNFTRHVEEFQFFLPALRKISHEFSPIGGSSFPHIEYSEGDMLFRSLFEKAFRDPFDLRIYRPLRTWTTSRYFSFIADQIQFIIRSKADSRMVIEGTPEAVKFFQKLYPKASPLNFLILPEEISFFSQECLIFGSEVLFLSPEKKSSFSLLVQSSDFANFSRSLFDFIWNIYNNDNGNKNNKNA